MSSSGNVTIAVGLIPASFYLWLVPFHIYGTAFNSIAYSRLLQVIWKWPGPEVGVVVIITNCCSY